ncbi:MAG: hypothetical protein ACREBG_26685 [Pyrinomonadaceae bacterium]
MQALRREHWDRGRLARNEREARTGFLLAWNTAPPARLRAGRERFQQTV